MNRRRSIRSTIKWGGAVLTILLLIVLVGSIWYTLRFGTYRRVIHVSGGFITYIWVPITGHPLEPNNTVYRHFPSFRGWWFIQTSMSLVSAYSIPLWVPLFLTAIPTTAMWRRDRKLRLLELANCCPKCGYDRTGLPADRACPECGAAVKASAISGQQSAESQS